MTDLHNLPVWLQTDGGFRRSSGNSKAFRMVVLKGCVLIERWPTCITCQCECQWQAADGFRRSSGDSKAFGVVVPAFERPESELSDAKTSSPIGHYLTEKWPACCCYLSSSWCKLPTDFVAARAFGKPLTSLYRTGTIWSRNCPLPFKLKVGYSAESSGCCTGNSKAFEDAAPFDREMAKLHGQPGWIQAADEVWCRAGNSKEAIRKCSMS